MAELVSFSDANAVQRVLRNAVATGPGSWLALRTLPALDRWVARATGSKHTFSSLTSGLPVVFLKTKGARSGRTNATPVLGLPSADGLALIASNYGRPKHPAWYHNLRANPECEIVVDGETKRCRAIEAEGEQRERIWRDGLEIYPGWQKYQERAPNRRIAVFVLEPV